MEVKSKIWLDKQGEMVFGRGKSLILKAIRDTGSINKAAKKLDMSYRHAWSCLHSAEKRLGKQLVVKIKGGQNGGGAVLTKYADDLLNKFDILDKDAKDFTSKRFGEVFCSDTGLKIMIRKKISKKAVESLPITKLAGDNSEHVEALLAREIYLNLIVNGRSLTVLSCMPLDLENLAAGFLFTAGIIDKASDIRNISIDRKTWSVFIELKNASKLVNRDFKKQIYTSSGGSEIIDLTERQSTIIANFTIRSADIQRLTAQFMETSAIYLKTGGVHSAAVTDKKKIIIFKEDIGRHNAVDKVIGRMLFKNIPFENKALITSGRISSEIIHKIHRCGIPVIISKSAPMDKAVDFAQTAGITIVGFARGQSMNIYCNTSRIIVA